LSSFPFLCPFSLAYSVEQRHLAFQIPGAEVRVSHHHLQAGVTEQLRDGTKRGSPHHEPACEGMPQVSALYLDVVNALCRYAEEQRERH